MPPDFLNSREDAIAVWAAIVLAFVLSKNARGIGGSFGAVLRAFLSPKLLLLFGTASVYSAGIVCLAERLDVWHLPALKATVYWFVGTALVVVGNAVTVGSLGGRAFIAKVLRRLVEVSALVGFVAGVYTLPLAPELFLVGIGLLFGGMQVVAAHDPSTPVATRHVIDAVLVSVGLTYLGYFVARVASDPGQFATRANAEDFLVAPLLTLALVPFLIGAGAASRREQRNLRRKLRVSDTPA